MRLVKYSASGNDFLIGVDSVGMKRSEFAKRVCERHHGIGADGLVILMPTPENSHTSYQWDFYNSDGSSAKMCGNASRSVGHYAFTEGLAPCKHSFLSPAGVIGIEVDGAMVQSDLGGYTLLKEGITQSNPYGINQWYLLDTGVPHLVGFVQDASILPRIRDSHLEYLRQVYDANINLAYAQHRPNQDSVIRFCTYERGVEDITQACGTGSAGVFAMAYRLGLCAKEAILIPPSQEPLSLKMGEDSHIFLKGRVSRIAVCEWLLEF